MEKRNYGGRVALQCEQCGTQFTRPASRVKPHAFCSKSCYAASPVHQQAVITANKRRNPNGGKRNVPCFHCGTEVRRFLSQLNARTFCKRECEMAYDRANPVRQNTPGGYIKIFVGP